MEISRRGWRTTEPFATRNETSQIWQKVFAQLRKENVGVEALAHKLRVPTDELVKLVFGWLLSRWRGPEQGYRWPQIALIFDW